MSNTSLGQFIEKIDIANHYPVLKINHPKAQAIISLFGGHVLSFNPGQEKLWLSDQHITDCSKAIRGGIPVCWPWFGDKENKQAHGFARNTLWHIEQVEESEQQVKLTLLLPMESHADFEGKFTLALEIIVSDELTLNLITHNIGDNPLEITAALHSYLAIGNIKETKLSGLSRSSYLDKLDNNLEKSAPDPYSFDAALDRIHKSTAETLLLQSNSHKVRLEQQGHDSIVVWNPWSEGAAKMSDMPDNGYQNFLCVEPAVTSGVTIAPGESHTLTATID